MPDRPTLPYGTWPSPISVEMAVAAGRGLSEPRPDPSGLYLLEARPDEGGRIALLRRAPDGSIGEVVPADLNVRTRVHEYGGGAYAVRDGHVVLSEFASNRLMYLPAPGATPRELTSDPALRFADMEIDLARERVIAVLEDHRSSDSEPRNVICSVSSVDGSVTELAAGHDFVSNPRLSMDGRRLAWLTWDHPDMPWNGTQLWVAEVAADGLLEEPMHVAGSTTESVLQPVWSPDGSLLFVSDRSGWWNPYRWAGAGSSADPLITMEAEFGGPAWVFGLSDLAVDADGTVLAVAASSGAQELMAFRPNRPARRIDVEGRGIAHLRVRDGVATFVATSPVRPSAIVSLDLESGRLEEVYVCAGPEVDAAYLSIPQHVEFPSTDGRASHAWFYPPTNPDVAAPGDERPPLVVMLHGGPTAQARTSLSLARQAFTSRGFAVVDVDYGGSSGYGRAYRELLRDAWGIVDVDDCTNAARWLADQGLVDGRRLAIRGGSAGGFTTLAALCFRDEFAAGTSFYGVADLEALTRFTHKFESRYLDQLVGPYPDQIEPYRERSPIYHVDAISSPVLVMQGEDDLVVPQAQADEIVAALKRNGVPHAYLLFPGEGHGFRQAQNQRRALEAELTFYAQVFGFRLADAIEPIELIVPDAPAAR